MLLPFNCKLWFEIGLGIFWITTREHLPLQIVAVDLSNQNSNITNNWSFVRYYFSAFINIDTFRDSRIYHVWYLHTDFCMVHIIHTSASLRFQRSQKNTDALAAFKTNAANYANFVYVTCYFVNDIRPWSRRNNIYQPDTHVANPLAIWADNTTWFCRNLLYPGSMTLDHANRRQCCILHVYALAQKWGQA